MAACSSIMSLSINYWLHVNSTRQSLILLLRLRVSGVNSPFRHCLWVFLMVFGCLLSRSRALPMDSSSVRGSRFCWTRWPLSSSSSKGQESPWIGADLSTSLSLWCSTNHWRQRRMSSSTDQVVEWWPEAAPSTICEGLLEGGVRVLQASSHVVVLRLRRLWSRHRERRVYCQLWMEIHRLGSVCLREIVSDDPSSYLSTVRLLINLLFLYMHLYIL